MLLVAPDKFKGTLDAEEVAAAIADGVRRARPGGEVEECPVADGGEGTLRALQGPLKLERRIVRVHGPRWDPVEASFGLAADRSVAVVELAEASGLALLPEHLRDPSRTTTYGAGELVRAAIAEGARRVIVALGGSATCDGGVGLAQALGVVFRDARGDELAAPITGERVERIASWDAEGCAGEVLGSVAGAGVPVAVTIEAAVDVDSPLLGPRGAARMFAPQKGASPAQVELLERGMEALVRARCGTGGRSTDSKEGLRLAPPDLAARAGAGAAGGCGFGLALFCGARLRPGAELVLETIGFDARVRGAELVVTGEGRLDASSLGGKAAIAVARAGQRCHVPVVVVAGELGSDIPSDLVGPQALVAEVISLVDRFGRERALHETAGCLREVGVELGGRMSKLAAHHLSRLRERSPRSGG